MRASVALVRPNRSRAVPTARHETLRHVDNGETLELYLGTVDGQGRFPLGQPAEVLGWKPGTAVAISTGRACLVFCRPPTCGATPYAVRALLDSRLRVLVPYGIRTMTRLEPGTKLAIVASARGELAIALPARRLVEAARDR